VFWLCDFVRIFCFSLILSIFGHKISLAEILLLHFLMRFSPVVFLQISLALHGEKDDIYSYFFLSQKAKILYKPYLKNDN